jgi:hypothetical protein
MNIVNQILLTILLILVSALFLRSMFDPTGFGEWLKQIDDARYEYTINE